MEIMKTHLILALFLTLLIIATGCKETNPPVNPPDNNLDSIQHTFGYGILDKLKGIWNGPVTSSTGLGSYPEWIVDFRPISASQISAKNELDTLNDIHLSFFISKYKNEYRVCFRNGGSFGGLKRVSYFMADSVYESSARSYYRFSEAIKGKVRAYTTVEFKNDSLIMTSFTNKFNTLSTVTQHMKWSAKLQDATSCQTAVSNFGFPQKVLAKDFSTAFGSDPEAVYYTLAADPYAENLQPYLGQTTINYTFTGGFTPDPAKKVFLMITTQPIISGFIPNTANLKYRSRYVILNANDNSFVFNYMHPGTYYLYALYDNDGNLTFSSGDRTSTANTTFILGNQGTTSATASINFVIP